MSLPDRPAAEAEPGDVVFLTEGFASFNVKADPALVVVVGRRSKSAYVFHPGAKMVLEAPVKILRDIEGEEELEARRIQKQFKRSIESLIEQHGEKVQVSKEEEEKLEKLKAEFKPGLYVLARGKDKKKAHGGKAAYLSGARVGFVAPDGSTHRSHLLNIHLAEEPPPFWTAEAEEETRAIYDSLVREDASVRTLAEYLKNAGDGALVEVTAENRPGVPVGAVCKLVKVAFRNATVLHEGRRRILSPLVVRPKEG